jgi:hypothetical protein
VIGNRSSKDAKNNRRRLFKARSKDQSEKLGFISNFSKGDDPARDEERFHKNSWAGLEAINQGAIYPVCEGVMVKDLVQPRTQ